MRLLLLIGLVACASVQATAAQGMRKAADLQTVALPAGETAMAPFLATSADGTVYLSWLEREEGMTRMRMSTRKAGESSGWTPPETISEGTDWFVNWADVPSVTVADDGTVLAHWLQRLGDGRYAYGIQYAVRRPDGTWTAPAWLHEDRSETEHGFLSAVWDGHAFVATWLDGAGYGAGRGEMEVHTRSIARDGALGPETVLDSRACDCCPTSMVRTREGAVVAAWRDRSEGEVRDIVRAARLADGAWSEPEPVHDDGWMINACPVNGPSLAVHGNSTGVAWFTAAGGEPAVLARVGTGPVVRIDSGKPAGRVASYMTSDTEMVVVWLESGLKMRSLRADGTLAVSWQLAEASDARATGYPRVAPYGPDRLLVVWTQEGLSALTVPLTLNP